MTEEKLKPTSPYHHDRMEIICRWREYSFHYKPKGFSAWSSSDTVVDVLGRQEREASLSNHSWYHSRAL